MSADAKNKKTFRNGLQGHGGLLGTLFAAALVATSLSPLSRSLVHAQQPNTAKPNILVIFGDDVGQSNISAYTRGVVGYKTPNIDRIANEGMICTHRLHPRITQRKPTWLVEVSTGSACRAAGR